MTVVALVLVFGAFSYSAVKLVSGVKRSLLSPITIWHALLIVLFYSRVIVLLVVDWDYRWLPSAATIEIAQAAIELTTLAIIATLALEFGFRISSAKPLTKVDQVRYSLPVASLVLVIGICGFILYYHLLGGISQVVSDTSASKSVRGGGLVLMATSLVWIAPPMVIAARDNMREPIRALLSLTFFLCACSIAVLYGRATPLVWGALLLFGTHYFGSRRVHLYRIIGIIVIALVFFVSYKAFRLAESWHRDVSTSIGYLQLYGDFILSDGGEQAITDMSLRVLIWGDSEFPLGSFWQRWVSWPLELTPRFLFPFEFEVATVGRQLYWWATGNYNINAGVPIFGFLSAYKTGSVGFLGIVYFFLGSLCGRYYMKASYGNTVDVVLYLMALCLLLFFSRLGDLSAAVVQVIVLGAVPWIALRFLNTFKNIGMPQAL